MVVEWVYALCNRLLSHFASGLLSFAVQASIALLFPWVTFSFPFLSKYCYQFRCCWLVDAMHCNSKPSRLCSERENARRYFPLSWISTPLFTRIWLSSVVLFLFSLSCIFVEKASNNLSLETSEFVLVCVRSFVWLKLLNFRHGVTETDNKSADFVAWRLDHHPHST